MEATVIVTTMIHIRHQVFTAHWCAVGDSGVFLMVHFRVGRYTAQASPEMAAFNLRLPTDEWVRIDSTADDAYIRSCLLACRQTTGVTKHLVNYLSEFVTLVINAAAADGPVLPADPGRWQIPGYEEVFGLSRWKDRHNTVHGYLPRFPSIMFRLSDSDEYGLVDVAPPEFQMKSNRVEARFSQVVGLFNGALGKYLPNISEDNLFVVGGRDHLAKSRSDLVRQVTWDEVLQRLAVDVAAAETNPPEAVVAKIIVESSRQLLRRLASQNIDWSLVDDRRFEELIATLLADIGFDVQLTRPRQDGGVDVIAQRLDNSGHRITLLIECKHFVKSGAVRQSSLGSSLTSCAKLGLTAASCWRHMALHHLCSAKK